MCRQCKRKPDDVYDGALESHVNELRKHQRETDLCIDQAICDIHYLFNTTESKSDNKQSTGKGQKENRSRRAKPQPEPDVDLTYSGIRKIQIDDEVIGFIVKWIEKHGDGNKPKFEELFHMHPECRFWYGRWELLTVHEGVLCIKWIHGNSVRLRICTPKSLRNALLWHFHDSPISGHQGV